MTHGIWYYKLRLDGIHGFITKGINLYSFLNKTVYIENALV